MSLVAFALAAVGAFVAFLPLIQVLLPIKAAEIAPRAPTAILGPIVAAGAVAAGVGNLVVGWLSDRSRALYGRRPWIVAGLGGILASYLIIALAHSAAALLAGTVAFQIALNVMFAPLLALVPDRVPASARGRASAAIALGSPFGTLIGIGGLGLIPGSVAVQLAWLGAGVSALVLPLVLTLRPEPASTPAPAALPPSPTAPVPATPPSLRRAQVRDFVLGNAARMCVILSFSIAQTCLFFYVAGIRDLAGTARTEHGVAVLGLVFGLASATMAAFLGPASDRARRRKPFVIAGSLLIAVGMAGLAAASSWAGAVAAYTVYSVGAGAHMAVEFALIVDILPTRDRAARDLGLMNLANIVPQVAAPLGLAWLASRPGSNIHWCFAAGALSAAIGAALVAAIRSAA